MTLQDVYLKGSLYNLKKLNIDDYKLITHHFSHPYFKSSEFEKVKSLRKIISSLHQALACYYPKHADLLNSFSWDVLVEEPEFIMVVFSEIFDETVIKHLIT